jgi:deazaflavin-dependent oxidoreductase (nitroreductase family)
MKASRFFWRLIRFGPRVAYAIGLGPIIGRFVLLLTTVGRKSGRLRVTPLVYVERDHTILVASARGPAADWLRNIQANRNVRVRVGRRQFDALAEPTSDGEKIADYLQSLMARNPRMFGAILRMEGLSSSPSRAELVRFGPRRPMVTLRPVNDSR